MGEVRRLAVATARTEVVPSPARLQCVNVRGFVTFAVLNEIVRRFDEAAGSDPDLQGVVLDALAIDGFEPGVPARLIQWLGANAGQVCVAVLVTTSPVLVATVRAAALLLPDTRFAVAGSRSDAYVLACKLMPDERRRSTTGTRPRVIPPPPAEVTRLDARRKSG